ncbi:Hypothetical protein, putative, partial [Bodo saltans]
GILFSDDVCVRMCVILWRVRLCESPHPFTAALVVMGGSQCNNQRTFFLHVKRFFLRIDKKTPYFADGKTQTNRKDVVFLVWAR